MCLTRRYSFRIHSYKSSSRKSSISNAASVATRNVAANQMPLRNYLTATAIFINEVKGKSALALSRDLNVQNNAAFVLAHKLREAMASELKDMRLGGDGETVEVDGGYFGGYVKQMPTHVAGLDRARPGHASA